MEFSVLHLIWVVLKEEPKAEEDLPRLVGLGSVVVVVELLMGLLLNQSPGPTLET
jgi:hypothetical protein